MGRELLCLIFMWVGGFSSYSQTQTNTVTGTVTDRSGPIYGATVQMKGSSLGTLTDESGTYKLTTVKTNDTLVYSYLGYQTREIIFDGSTVIDVELSESLNELDAVVVNAGYYTVSEKERTGSIASISGEAIERQPVGNTFQVMQGRLTGVSITQTTGVPGGRFVIQIRGRNSITSGNEPLYVIDGVPFMSDAMEGSFSSPSNQGGNPLQSLNVADIERIEILKDADATAIYGSRGANGVVLITTKKGKAGAAKLSVSVQSGASQLTRFWDMLSTEQYLAMRQEAFANTGATPTVTNAPDLLLWDQNAYTDWQRDLLGGTAGITEAQLAVSGGSEQTRFRLGAAFREQGSVFPGDFKNRKLSGNVSVNHQSQDGKLQVQGSVNYSRDFNVQPLVDPTLIALYVAPNAPEPFLPDGSLNWAEGTWSNPYAQLMQHYENTQYAFIGNAGITYRLFQGLSAKVNAGYNRMQSDQIGLVPVASLSPYTNSTGYANSGLQQFGSWIVEPQLTYSHALAGGQLEVLLGTSFQDNERSVREFNGNGYTDDAFIRNLQAAPVFSITQFTDTEYRYMAVFGRVNYNYKHKYILNLTGRRDGSSRFGPGKRWGNFGAVGAAWLFSEEDWFKDSVLSYGKLRGSYGTSGNDRIADYGYFDSWTTHSVDYAGQGGLYPSRLFNDTYSWEVNKKLEVALETGFWKDRIRLNAAWYHNRSSAMLVRQPLPLTTGFNSIQNNLNAIVENTGWELELQATPVRSEDFQWNSSVLLTIPKNKLVSFPGLEESTYASTYIIGEPLESRYMYQYEGIDPETGFYTFKDFNGDGNITTGEDKKAIGRVGRKYYGSFQNTLQYKGLELQVLMEFVNQTGYNYNYLLGSAPGYLRNQPAIVWDRWQQAGDVATVQAYITGGAGANAYTRLGQSTYNITDASFMRLRQVSLSYRLPHTWLHALKADSVRLFVEGQNLLTFTHYQGFDPETQSNRILPPLTTWMAGIQVSF